MIVVGNSIVSEDIRDEKFCCNLESCKGVCCVEGDAGAPLEKKEIEIIEKYLPQIEKYMSEIGKQEIAQKGVWDIDMSQELCVRIIGDKDCVFLTYDEDVALCAIEKAYRDGKIDFQKPISCHLYPIRVQDYGEFQAVNYHRWDICSCAVSNGKRLNTPLYEVLKEPLIRRFGENWYEELLLAVKE